MVAGTALVHGLPPLTRDVREFERVPGLAVLTVGPAGSPARPAAVFTSSIAMPRTRCEVPRRLVLIPS